MRTLRALLGAGSSVAVAALAAAVVGYGVTGTGPAVWLALLVPLAAVGAALQLRSARFLPLLALAVPLIPLPEGVPLLLPVGGRSLFVTDVLVPAVALWALRAPSCNRGADRAVQVYAAIVTALALVGMLRGAELSAVVQDLRGPLYLVCGYLIASRRVQWSDRVAVVRIVGAVLWWSAVAIVFTLVTGEEVLQGRVGTTAASLGGGAKESLDAVRFLIAPKELALVTAVGAVGVLVLRAPVRHVRRLVVGLLVPALFVVFMAFSRQSVVGAAAALVYLLVVSPFRSQTLVRIASGAALVGVGLLLLGAVGLMAPLTADGTIVRTQLDAYGERVVTGLVGRDNATEDPGNQFRLSENRAALDFAGRHPFVGGGLGTPYREAGTADPFSDVEYGRRYVHDVYLWYAAHGGVLGVLAIVVLAGRPILRVLVPAFRARSGQELVLAAGAAYVALLAVGVFEPVIHLNSTAPLFGALLGFFAHAEAGARRPAAPAPGRGTAARVG